MLLALAGNQNCGKTTLFNQLTGEDQHVGNFPGITVDAKVGYVRKNKDIEIVDLPGVYSLSPYSGEEIITRDFIINEKPDCIINVIDATNIERSLYLTLQLTELGIPVVIALNMMDELCSSRGDVKLYDFQKMLNLPAVAISARKNIGLDRLIDVALNQVGNKRKYLNSGIYIREVEYAIKEISAVIKEKSSGLPITFAAVKLFEGDQLIEQRLGLGENESALVEEIISTVEEKLKKDRKTIIACMRYRFIEKVCSSTVEKGKSLADKRDEFIDRILLNKVLAIPLFLIIMLSVFYLTFKVCGQTLDEVLTSWIALLQNRTAVLFESMDISPIVSSLVTEGVFGGVGSVLSFLPTITVLFFLLSLLEESGYMARAVFIMDKLLGRLGLSGRGFVPMLIGFGCTVPAVMATRTIKSERERLMTVKLLPFISCSAKIPVYAVFTSAFFDRYRALVMLGLYIFGIVIGIISILLVKGKDAKSERFIIELPHYRMPRLKNTLVLLCGKIREFLCRAFTVIFLTSVVVWFLKTLDTGFNPMSDSGKSMLAYIGRAIAPIFAPLGFNDWRVCAALVTGFSAKEAVVSTLSVLCNTDAVMLPQAIREIFTPVSAVSFMVFTLLYTPCAAAVNAVRCEFKSNIAAIGLVIYQTGIAWLCAAAIYQIASII